MFSNIFVYRTIFEIMWKKYRTTRHPTEDNTVHSHCVLATRTPGICNPYCFSTEIMVERKRLSFTLYVH
jgi:hypothetical protein